MVEVEVEVEVEVVVSLESRCWFRYIDLYDVQGTGMIPCLYEGGEMCSKSWANIKTRNPRKISKTRLPAKTASLFSCTNIEHRRQQQHPIQKLKSRRTPLASLLEAPFNFCIHTCVKYRYNCRMARLHPNHLIDVTKASSKSIFNLI